MSDDSMAMSHLVWWTDVLLWAVKWARFYSRQDRERTATCIGTPRRSRQERRPTFGLLRCSRSRFSVGRIVLTEHHTRPGPVHGPIG